MPAEQEMGEGSGARRSLASRTLGRSTGALRGQNAGSLTWLLQAEPSRPMRDLLWRLWLPLVLVQAALVPVGGGWGKLVHGVLLASGLVASLALAYCGTVRVTGGTGIRTAQRSVVGFYLAGILASVTWWTGWSNLQPATAWQRALVWPIELLAELAVSLVPG